MCLSLFFSRSQFVFFTHSLPQALPLILLSNSLTNHLTLFFHLLSFIDSLSHPFTHSLIPNSQQCCGCPAGGAVSWWVSSVEVHWLWWKHRSEESGWKQHPPEWGQTDESYTHLFTSHMFDWTKVFCLRQFYSTDIFVLFLVLFFSALPVRPGNWWSLQRQRTLKRLSVTWTLSHYYSRNSSKFRFSEMFIWNYFLNECK